MFPTRGSARGKENWILDAHLADAPRSPGFQPTDDLAHMGVPYGCS